MHRLAWLLLALLLCVGFTPANAAPPVITGSATFVDTSNVTLCPQLPVESPPTAAGTQDEVRREPGTYPIRVDADVTVTLRGAPWGLLQIRVYDDAGRPVGKQPPWWTVKSGKTVSISANLPPMDVSSEGTLSTTITKVTVQLYDKTGKFKLGQPSTKVYTQPGGGC